MTRQVKRRHAICHGIALALCLMPAVAHASDDVIDVTLDKAKIIRMPARAQTIVVGNPVIADVTTLKVDGLVVVTGKGFGETNMIFLDKSGSAIQEANVRVLPGTSQLVVQRGMDVESWSCRPRCEPTVTLGDATAYYSNGSTQIQTRNKLADPGQSH